MTPRVPLYGRSPAGVGTPRVESLTSYASRLAAARYLSTTDVFGDLIFPELPSHIRPKVRNLAGYLSRDAVGLDGMGSLTEHVVTALEKLTGQDSLDVHTLLPWAEVISERNPGALLRGSKRWCEQCFHEWHQKGIEPWEPLIWRIAPVERCPVHGSYLSHLCPSCHMPQPAVTKDVPIGRCSRRDCRAVLHGNAVRLAPMDWLDPKDEDPSTWQGWTAIAMGRMLAVQHEARLRANSLGFVYLLIDAVRDLAGGSSTELAKRLGVSYATLHRWASESSRPRLDYFLAVSMRLGADPAAVGMYPYGAPFSVPWKIWRYRDRPWPSLALDPGYRHIRYSPAFWDDIESRLRLALNERGGRSVSEIARSLDVSVPALRTHFPDLMKDLAARYARRTRQERQKRFRHQEDRIRKAVTTLASQGVYPSAKRTFDLAGLSGSLALPRLRRVWRDAQRLQGIDPYQ